MSDQVLEHWVRTYRLMIELGPTDASFDVEIDHRVVTDTSLRERNEFWGDAKRRSANCGSDRNAVLKLLALVLLDLAFDGYTLEGAIAKFASGIEGWPKMDGSEGWRLTSFESPSFDITDVSIGEL